MKMPALIAIVSLLITWPSWALGDTIVSLNSPGSATLHEVQVLPGGTFNVDLNLDTDLSLYTLRLLLRANEAGIFEIFDRSNHPSWSGTSGIGPLSPISNTAVWTWPFPGYFGPGISSLGTLGLMVNPNAREGSYSLAVDAGSEYAADRMEPALAGIVPGSDFSVHVIAPEAGSLLLLLPGALLVRRPR